MSAGILLCCLAQAASAAEFHLKDGSVVFGKILSLVDGEDLFIDTEHMGEIKIEWKSIVLIRDTEVVEVEFFSGRRILGRVTYDEGNLSIKGDTAVSVKPASIFAISEVHESAFEALEANVDLGMNVVRGNNRVTQASLGYGLGYETVNFETGVNGTLIINEQSETSDTRRMTFNANYTRKFDAGWQASGFYQFESDEQQELDGRSLYGAILENRVINRRRHRLGLYGGLAVNSEEFTGTPRTETLEGVLGARYRMRWFADADVAFTLLPNLEDSSRVRTQFDGSLSFDLFSDFDFKITVYDRYDSQPPAGNKKNDTGVTLGLSWEY